jgi:hypothetical protein
LRGFERSHPQLVCVLIREMGSEAEGVVRFRPIVLPEHFGFAPPPGGHGRLTLSIHTWISFAGRTTRMKQTELDR